MSNTLQVTLDGRQLDTAGEANLQDLYRTAAQSAVPPSVASSIRLVFRREPHGTTIEPFLGSAAFEALLRIAKKRKDATALLVILVACSLLVCERVGVLLVAEDTPLPNERTDLSFKALREQRLVKGAWYRIVASPAWFHFTEVEAKLLRPLKLENGQLATHYFRDFWVRAVERQIAQDAVVTVVTKDAATMVAFGEVLGEPPPSSLEGRGNFVAGGRIYFSDQS